MVDVVISMPSAHLRSAIVKAYEISSFVLASLNLVHQIKSVTAYISG